MCCCAKPNVNGTPGYSWDGKGESTRPVDPPAIGDADVLLFDEPGRCGGIDSHCHHYRLVKNGGTSLLVRNGGGQERFYLSLPNRVDLSALDSNTRYWIFNAIYHARSDGRRGGEESESSRWRQAAAEKRIQVRKIRGKNQVKVSIKPAEVQRAS